MDDAALVSVGAALEGGLSQVNTQLTEQTALLGEIKDSVVSGDGSSLSLVPVTVEEIAQDVAEYSQGATYDQVQTIIELLTVPEVGGAEAPDIPGDSEAEALTEFESQSLEFSYMQTVTGIAIFVALLLTLGVQLFSIFNKHWR